MPDEGSRAKAVGHFIHKAYSGYVHAASPHIMDMYGASPGRFDVTGESRRVRGGQHRDDAWNYLLRGTMSVTAAAKAFGDAALVSEIHNAQPSSARLLAYRELNLTLITARKFDQRIVIGSDTI